MKITHVAVMPTESATAAGRPALTPELMAATGARYSRSNDGLGAIISKIDFNNTDKSVDGIFKMMDYGHASIADMAPVAMFLDGISMYAAYYIFSISPQGGGQESSTRYLKLGPENLMSASDLGIQEECSWHSRMVSSFKHYSDALAVWEKVAEEQPHLIRIPTALLSQSSPSAWKAVDRIKRNFAFDRARYYIPLATATNMMLVQSARCWVEVASHLLSHNLLELNTIGKLIIAELELVTPRLVKHAVAKPSTSAQIDKRFARLVDEASRSYHIIGAPAHSGVRVQVSMPHDFDARLIHSSLEDRDNRYSIVGDELCRVSVRFGWEAMTMAEIRDLNRHRTGNKYVPLIPKGFYGAQDELPSGLDDIDTEFGSLQSNLAHSKLAAGDACYIYDTLLGTQFPFEHTTTADKFIYEAELRTGVGSHYRYAQHLREALQAFYVVMPESRGLIMEGQAEPE